MKNSTISKQRSYTTDLYSTNAVKSRKLSMLWLMLFTLLLVPTRMVAQNTTEDPRCALFNGLDGISDVTITDNSSYPWQMLDLNAKGMENLGFKIPPKSTGLMSSNYNMDRSTSETVVNFTVEKPMLLTFKFLVSSEQLCDNATITLDDKESRKISGMKQIENKALLSVGKHSLKLSYTKNGSGYRNADRTCIYDLKTATTYSEYVADYDATNSTLTFKKITSDKLEGLDLSRMAIVNDGQTMKDMCTNNYSSIKNIIFDESFKTYAPTSLREFFKGCKALETISGLEYLNTANVTDMNSMFYGCSALTTIYASDNFKTEKVGISDNMFWECNNLKGFIEYNKNNTDLQYANYKTGYFTKLVGKNGEEKIGAAGETLTAESLALDDNKDFVAYEPFAAKSASYSRTMNAGTTWATLCLPFEVSLDGKNFRAFKLLSADEGTETVELEEVKTIEAGTPVIIKMKEGATELKFTEANKNIAKDVLTTATADGYQLQGLYTQKEFSKDADNNCYIVKGNKLMNPAMLLEKTKVQKVASKPFRAYMVDNSSAPTAGAKMFSIGFDNDGTTAIDSLNTIADDKAEYYDLQGKRLNEPQKGINIVKRGGKTMKVIIK